MLVIGDGVDGTPSAVLDEADEVILVTWAGVDTEDSIFHAENTLYCCFSLVSMFFIEPTNFTACANYIKCGWLCFLHIKRKAESLLVDGGKSGDKESSRKPGINGHVDFSDLKQG